MGVINNDGLVATDKAKVVTSIDQEFRDDLGRLPEIRSR